MATTTDAPAVADLVAPGARLELVGNVAPASAVGGAEGPLWLPDGRLLVSDVVNDVVVVFDASGARSRFRRPSNGANGHALAADGSVLEADAGAGRRHGGIAKVARDGSAKLLVDSFHGKRFNSPNDLAVKRDGTIWFTDPDFERTVPPEIAFNGVYRLDPATGSVTLLTKAMNEPNGIAFSPDQKTLYVSDTEGGLFGFPVAADGTVGPSRFLDFLGCDGIGVDERGDVWETTCSNNVVVTDPDGKELGSVAVPGKTTNVAWGGADGRTLYVTTQDGGVYRLALTVREAS